jgi:ABC-type multidrug transport system fused ATPase/permease subunit
MNSPHPTLAVLRALWWQATSTTTSRALYALAAVLTALVPILAIGVLPQLGTRPIALSFIQHLCAWLWGAFAACWWLSLGVGLIRLRHANPGGLVPGGAASLQRVAFLLWFVASVATAAGFALSSGKVFAPWLAVALIFLAFYLSMIHQRLGIGLVLLGLGVSLTGTGREALRGVWATLSQNSVGQPLFSTALVLATLMAAWWLSGLVFGTQRGVKRWLQRILGGAEGAGDAQRATLGTALTTTEPRFHRQPPLWHGMLSSSRVYSWLLVRALSRARTLPLAQGGARTQSLLAFTLAPAGHWVVYAWVNLLVFLPLIAVFTAVIRLNEPTAPTPDPDFAFVFLLSLFFQGGLSTLSPAILHSNREQALMRLVPGTHTWFASQQPLFRLIGAHVIANLGCGTVLMVMAAWAWGEPLSHALIAFAWALVSLCVALGFEFRDWSRLKKDHSGLYQALSFLTVIVVVFVASVIGGLTLNRWFLPWAGCMAASLGWLAFRAWRSWRAPPGLVAGRLAKL